MWENALWKKAIRNCLNRQEKKKRENVVIGKLSRFLPSRTFRGGEKSRETRMHFPFLLFLRYRNFFLANHKWRRKCGEKAIFKFEWLPFKKGKIIWRMQKMQKNHCIFEALGLLEASDRLSILEWLHFFSHNNSATKRDFPPFFLRLRF